MGTPLISTTTIPQHPMLGRQKAHDVRSRAFPQRTTVDRSTWRDKAIRVYDPIPNPNQCHGECTGVAKMIQMNSVGNRVKGRVLDMDDAHRNYARNTEIDIWDGVWPPEDTGSSGLASCKSAIEQGIGGEYRWLFGGADEVVQNIIEGRTISIGTWWYDSMFGRDRYGRVSVSGSRAGGHQYVGRGYDVDKDWVLCRCWWGTYRDFWIARTDLNDLLMDDGDAHWQVRA